MAESRTTWEQGLRRDYAQRKREIIAQRLERTRDITLLWRAGFAQLKGENDRLQMERDEEFHNSMVANDTWLREKLAIGFPK